MATAAGGPASPERPVPGRTAQAVHREHRAFIFAAAANCREADDGAESRNRRNESVGGQSSNHWFAGMHFHRVISVGFFAVSR